MCGLVGSYGFINPDVNGMLASIAHRGPDGNGAARIGSTVLGHTRLAVQDVTDAAAQPLHYAGVTLTYSGEAWNTTQLRAQLPGPWQTTGDTEVVAALLADTGYAGLDRVDGMFALAWNDRAGTWLARDRWGKVPLHVVRHGDQWRWASEIKALPFGQRATAVAPGTAIHVDTGRVYRWATPPADIADPDPATVLRLLRDGIRSRLISDRPVCFLLSGGLDSSLVLALACELNVDPVAYTAVLDSASADLRFARRVAAELSVPLVEVPVPNPDRAALSLAVRAVEVPLKTQVEIALAHLPLAHAIASDGFRVVLSGEAADELFGGYGNHAIAAAATDDDGWRAIRAASVAKMAWGNFTRVNKVFMAAGVEGRLPFMHEPLVALTLAAGKRDCPPGKGLLKAAARGVLPLAVIARPKLTFQGATGTSAAAAGLVAAPSRFYNAEAYRLFGWLPHG